MDYTIISCVDCNEDFEFTEKEKAFYTKMGFNAPKRCGSCRLAKKAKRGDLNVQY